MVYQLRRTVLSLSRWLPLLLCASSAAQFVPAATTESLMRLGSDAMRQGKASAAEGYFHSASTQSPALPDAWLGLGLAQLREGKVHESQASLGQALTLNPKLPGAHLFLGIALYQQNQSRDAASAIEEELRMQPANVEALTWLGIVQLGAGHPELATQPLDQAVKLSPSNADLLYYQGHAHMLMAQNIYQALYRLDPDSWQIHRALGEDFAASGQPEKAIAEIQKAIAKQPSNADLYELLGDENQKMSRFDEAIAAYRMQLQLNPHNGIALYNLGKIQVERGDPEGGVTLLRQAVGANASVPSTSFYLGFGLAKLGKTQEAVEWLERSLASDPSDFIKQSAYFELGRAYQKLGRKEDARVAIEKLKMLKEAHSTAQ